MKKKTVIAFISGLLISVGAAAQRTSFLDHLRIGFGAGVNLSQIIDLEPYNIYEDLTGETYRNDYSELFQNIGNQYFVQIEWFNDFLVVNLKPGTYTHRFSKYSEVVFSQETFGEEVPYLLRYLSVPVEVRYHIDLQRFRPYAGITVAYSHLLDSNDPVNQTLIRSKLSAGGVAGTYIDLRYVILDLNAGYLSGLHNVASKAQRFETGTGASFAQDDLLLNNFQLSLSILFSLQKQKHYSNVECFY